MKSESPLHWFDTHAHLADEQFDLDREAVIASAFSSGVASLIEIADGPSEWEKARILAEKYPGQIWWAAGLHPYMAEADVKEVILRLRDYCSHPQFVAIGEIGLDYGPKCSVPKDLQKRVFQSLLDFSLDQNKPLIIHCRDAMPDLINLLQKRVEGKINPSGPLGVIHCFSGNFEEARECLKLGFYLGIDGPLTYPKAHELRRVAQTAPLESLVLETDSPYLPPQAFRGRRNDPSSIPIIGRELARLREISPEQLSSALRKSSDKLFRIKRLDLTA